MNLFLGRDEHHRREQKRFVANAHGLSSLLEMKPGVDSCTQIFLDKLGSYADRKESFGLGSWLQYYSFDMVGDSFSLRNSDSLKEGEMWTA